MKRSRRRCGPSYVQPEVIKHHVPELARRSRKTRERRFYIETVQRRGYHLAPLTRPPLQPAVSFRTRRVPSHHLSRKKQKRHAGRFARIPRASSAADNEFVPSRCEPGGSEDALVDEFQAPGHELGARA